MDEIWNDINGFENYYQVSNIGRIRSIDRIIFKNNRWGNKTRQVLKGKILSLKENNRGYQIVCLSKNNNNSYFLVHRLVAQAFIPNQDNLSQVNHIDENKHNNSVDNLEWCTNKENHNHGTGHIRTSLHPNYLSRFNRAKVDLGSGKIYVTSDLHFGHNNVIKYENRPFKNVEDMEQGLINNWNNKVKDGDVVYILGDLFFCNSERAHIILKQLNGYKIWVTGNHDGRVLKDESIYQYFVKIVDYLIIEHKKKHIVMFHHPIACWDGMERGSIHLYGHIHSNSHSLPKGFNREQSYNVGVDTNNYELVDLDWILNIIEMRKEPEKYIPKNTFYCYEHLGELRGGKNNEIIGYNTKVCPFWDKLVNKPEQENGVCHYLCTTDEELGLGLLWDQCKECGVNDYEDN